MMAVADVLKTIAEDKSLVLFNTIALSNSDTDILISTLHLTRKQYYAASSAKNVKDDDMYFITLC
jgi:hypothetical protein